MDKNDGQEPSEVLRELGPLLEVISAVTSKVPALEWNESRTTWRKILITTFTATSGLRNLAALVELSSDSRWIGS